MKTIRIGSRESALAVAQAELVMQSIASQDSSIKTELVTFKTKGDKDLENPVSEIGGKEAFTKELEQALQEGKVDLCVHSLKDMPVDISPRLPICATSVREDARDVLLMGYQQSGEKRPIGTSSLRRSVQLQALMPGCQVAQVRGNVHTRLQKLDSGLYDGLVLAAAGIRRLGLDKRITSYFALHQMIPACGQGIIAVQSRAGEPVGYLAGFHSAESWDAALAERTFLKVLGGGCTSPVAAHARVKGSEIELSGYVLNRAGEMVKNTFRSDRSRAEKLGVELAVYLLVEADK